MVCVRVRALPYVCAALNPLLRRAPWQDVASWQTARQDILEFKEALMSGCDMRVMTDLAVLLAKAHGLDFSEQLTAAMPALAAALENAETADTAGAMADIYRHSQETTKNDTNIEALGSVLVSLLTNGTVDPATAMAVIAAVRDGGPVATSALQSLLDTSIGKDNNQLETYIRGIADLIGGHTLPPVD